MKLFDDIIRTDQQSKRKNESIFDYMNNSGRASVAGVRALLEAWFERFPDNAQFRGRFRSRIDFQHQGAFFELYLHEMLLSMGFELVLEPEMAGEATTHPDFKVLLDGQPRFYLEAILAAGSEAEAAEDARMSAVFNVINCMNSPNFILSVYHSGVPASSPPARRLCQELERWLSSLDPDEHARIAEQAGVDQLPIREWQHEDWKLTFRAFPKSLEYRGQPGAPVIAVIGPSDAAVVETHVPVRSAVRRKATKYGNLDLPYIVAVNIIEPLADQIDVFNALFGQEQLTVSLCHEGDLLEKETRASDGGQRRVRIGSLIEIEKKTRVPNGAWFGPKGPQNTRVSAVLAGYNLTPWVSATRTPEMVHNPWALSPLSSDLWPLPQVLINKKEDCLEEITGKAAIDFLTFPDSWPLADN